MGRNSHITKRSSVVKVKFQDGDPRACDYCNKLLVTEESITMEEYFFV
jgi:hypothetical protein